jgi:hypothetical protein
MSGTGGGNGGNGGSGGLPMLAKYGSISSLCWGQRAAADARAAAVSGIQAMPDKPLHLLYQMVELMKVRSKMQQDVTAPLTAVQLAVCQS